MEMLLLALSIVLGLALFGLTIFMAWAVKS